jgi:hypothetical protein
MLDRDRMPYRAIARRGLIAVALSVAICGLVAAAYSQPNEGANPNSDVTNYQSQAPTQPPTQPNPVTPRIIQNDISRIANALETANAHPNAAEEQQQAIDNIKAQRAIAKWAKITAVIAGIDTIVTFIGVVLVGFTLDATRRAASAAVQTVEHMRGSTHTELRAYIGIRNNGTVFVPMIARVATGGEPVEAVRTEKNGTIAIYTLNYGKTPARNAAMYFHIMDGDSPSSELNDGLCKLGANPQILHPGQSFGKILGERKPFEPFFIYGYVDYSDIFGHRWRFRFAYSHDYKRLSDPKGRNDEWIAHTEHNDEQDMGEEAPA